MASHEDQKWISDRASVTGRSGNQTAPVSHRMPGKAMISPLASSASQQASNAHDSRVKPLRWL